ncbi:LysR family transcriptional regulator [Enterococcus florum]|uniref:LysR family transcriptional regulator n=1 Tax=Enterococcus florum TaxID=2480627 RepID=A0A4P5PFR2_9ENTE|nr:LysR family transcriptional regulator [Enterococcus florum]GCF95098.1 LysR family transcriptional regulator [Enterococcus florum]
MELKNLYTIKKIVETGSYQKTAHALNYAQSTITFQVQQIERELDIQLFEKKGKRMVLSQAGKEVFPLITQVLDSSEKLASYNHSKTDLHGSLKIALPESLITYKMQPILKAFKEKAPFVHLSLQVMNCYKIYDEMMNGTIDLAIHYDVKKYSPNIRTKEIASYPLTLISSPLLDDAERDFTKANQKKAICHIQNDTNALYLKIFNQYLKEKKIILETEMELWSIESIKRSVESNLGIAFLPRFTVEEELANRKLIELETDLSETNFTAIYALNSNRWMSPELELFTKILDEYFTV